MKIKTSELTGSALDWAVAKCIAQVHDNALLNGSIMHWWWISGLFADPNYWIRTDEFNPSTNWALGGPIIQREHIGLISPSNRLTMFWTADIGFESKFTQFDHDPLIAAMRCYCCSKLGDMIDIPDELIGEFK